jgi:hypothetical protein
VSRLVGSEMCIRDRMYTLPEAVAGSKFTVTGEAIRGEKPVTVTAPKSRKSA